MIFRTLGCRHSCRQDLARHSGSQSIRAQTLRLARSRRCWYRDMGRSRSILRTLFVTMLCMAFVSCGDDVRMRSDASADSGRPPDGGPPESSVDAATADGMSVDGSPCDPVASYSRCDRGCACPVEHHCRDDLGLCVPIGFSASCSLDLAPGSDAGIGNNPCADGTPCLIAQHRDGGPYGICASPQLCASVTAAGLPAAQCSYADGTVFSSGPPTDSCPTSDPSAPFCAGSCGSALCPDVDILGMHMNGWCIGTSDTRAFGVCAYDRERCGPNHTIGEFNICMSNYGGQPCACMVLKPVPDGISSEGGYMVLGSACQAYQAIYPDGVECRRLDWSEL